MQCGSELDAEYARHFGRKDWGCFGLGQASWIQHTESWSSVSERTFQNLDLTAPSNITYCHLVSGIIYSLFLCICVFDYREKKQLSIMNIGCFDALMLLFSMCLIFLSIMNSRYVHVY